LFFTSPLPKLRHLNKVRMC